MEEEKETYYILYYTYNYKYMYCDLRDTWDFISCPYTYWLNHL